MKKFLLLAFMATFLYGCANGSGYSDKPKHGKVAIIETISDGSTTFEENRALTRYMSKITKETFNAFVYTMMWESIKPMLIPGMVLEQCNSECLVDVGRNMGVDYVTQAYIRRTEDGYSVTTEMYDMSSGLVIASGTAETASRESIERSVFISTVQMHNRYLDGK